MTLHVLAREVQRLPGLCASSTALAPHKHGVAAQLSAVGLQSKETPSPSVHDVLVVLSPALQGSMPTNVKHGHRPNAGRRRPSPRAKSWRAMSSGVQSDNSAAQRYIGRGARYALPLRNILMSFPCAIWASTSQSGGTNLGQIWASRTRILARQPSLGNANRTTKVTAALTCFSRSSRAAYDEGARLGARGRNSVTALQASPCSWMATLKR